MSTPTVSPTERVHRKLLIIIVSLLTGGALQWTGDARWAVDLAVVGLALPLAVQKAAVVAVEHRWTPLLALLGESLPRPALPPPAPAEEHQGPV